MLRSSPLTFIIGEYRPPRKLRSKKMRMIRKWYKKYLVNKQVFTGCTISGYTENIGKGETNDVICKLWGSK